MTAMTMKKIITDSEDNNEDDDSDGEKIEIVSNLNKKVQNLVGEIGKKSRGKNEAYVSIAKFNDKKEALVELDTQNCWIKGTRKENKSDGTKQNYLCVCVSLYSRYLFSSLEALILIVILA